MNPSKPLGSTDAACCPYRGRNFGSHRRPQPATRWRQVDGGDWGLGPHVETVFDSREAMARTILSVR